MHTVGLHKSYPHSLTGDSDVRALVVVVRLKLLGTLNETIQPIGQEFLAQTARVLLGAKGTHTDKEVFPHVAENIRLYAGRASAER